MVQPTVCNMQKQQCAFKENRAQKQWDLLNYPATFTYTDQSTMYTEFPYGT